MAGNRLPVHAHNGFIVCRSEVQELPFSLFGGGLELLAVPYGPFVIVELFPLGVPVGGDLQRGCGIEVVLNEFGLVVRKALVGKEGVFVRHYVVPVVVVAGFILVHEGLPVSVQAQGLPALYVLDRGAEPEGAVVTFFLT